MKKISDAIERRLPVYYRHVRIMAAEGKKRVTSEELAEKAGNTGIQVRQDIYTCGGTDNYCIDSLEKFFSKILGIDEEHHMIVLGVGNLGRAIMGYKGFEKDRFFIDAAFDSNSLYEGTDVCGIPILNTSMLCSYLRNNKVDIAVIATPPESVDKTVEELIDCGVRGIWNFSPCDLKSTDKCIIRNIHLMDSLMTLSFKMKTKERLNPDSNIISEKVCEYIE